MAYTGDTDNGSILGGLGTQVAPPAPPTPPPAPQAQDLTDLGAIQVAPPTTSSAQQKQAKTQQKPVKAQPKTPNAQVSVPQVDPASGMPSGSEPTDQDVPLSPETHGFAARVHDFMTMPSSQYDQKYAADDEAVNAKVQKIAGKVIPLYNEMSAVQKPIESTKAGKQAGDFVRDQLAHPEQVALGGEFGGGMAAAAGELPGAVEEGLKQAGNAAIDVLAHPPVRTNAVAAAERGAVTVPNPRFDDLGGIEVKPPTHTVVETTIPPHEYLNAVGANDSGALSDDAIQSYRKQIRQDPKNVQPSTIEYDEFGNIAGGDGRHRATAHALEGTERMPVRVLRRVPEPAVEAAPVEEPTLQGDEPQWHEKAAADLEQNGGFSINPHTGEVPTEGHFGEAVPENRQTLDKVPTPEDIRAFAEKPENKRLLDEYPEMHVGGYKNQDGQYELNLSAAAKDPEVAKRVFGRLDQEATYDAATGQLNDAGGKNQVTEHPDYDIHNRMLDLRNGENPDMPATLKKSTNAYNPESRRAAAPERYTHYSSKPIEGDAIAGQRRGEAVAGSEGARLQHDNKVPGVYAYREGSAAESQIGSRANKNTIVGNKNLADISGAQKDEFEAAHKVAFDQYKTAGDNDTIASQKALNDAEAHLRDAGYDGYEHVQGRPGTVFLFGDQPIEGAGQNYRVPVLHTAGKALEIPPEMLTEGASTESTLHHEAAHAILGSMNGAQPFQIISHLHPDSEAEGFAAAADFDFRDWGGDANGNLPDEEAAAHVKPMLDMIAAGGVSDEHYHGIPWDKNEGIGGDKDLMDQIMEAAEVPEEDRPAMIETAKENARKVLTHPGVREIIEKHTSTRPEGLDETLHMDDDGIRAMTDEVKGKYNGDTQESSREHDSDNQKDVTQPKGQSSQTALRTEQKRKIEPTDDNETISTRVPTAKKAVEDSMTHGLVVDSKPIYEHPELAAKMANEVRNYPGFKAPEGASDAETLDAFRDHIKDNIKFIYNQTTPEEREAHGGWYDGALNYVKEKADKYGLTPRQGAAVTASMSPQKDWDMNAGLADRVMDIWSNHQKTKTTPEMMAKGKSLASVKNDDGSYKNAALRKLLPKIEGKKFGDLNPDLQALWVRLRDEAHNPREFSKINPDGSEGFLRIAGSGDPEKIAWGSLSEIGKAISVLRDGSRDNISESLGGSHKIRNFYNNIIEPNSPRQDVTIDTHAVAGAQLRPLSGNNPETRKNFGGISHAMSGTKGTYALYADAYRDAAKDLDIPHARMLQSITWEKIRDMFPAEIKTKENLGEIDGIWKEFTDGKIDRPTAQQKISDAAKGFAGGRGDTPAQGSGGTSDQGKLFEPGVSGESAEGTGRRSGGSNSAAGKVGKGKAKGVTSAMDFLSAFKK